MPKLTQTHFDKFKKYCYKWQKELGCMDWRIDINSDNLEHSSAEYETFISDKVIVITLSTAWETEPTDRLLEITAFHELFEGLVLSDIWKALNSSGMSQSKIDNLMHSVVRRMENILFPN